VRNVDYQVVRIVRTVINVESVHKYVLLMTVHNVRRMIVNHVLSVKDVQFVNLNV
jgi:hypothetical protein